MHTYLTRCLYKVVQWESTHPIDRTCGAGLIILGKSNMLSPTDLAASSIAEYHMFDLYSSRVPAFDIPSQRLS